MRLSNIKSLKSANHKFINFNTLDLDFYIHDDHTFKVTRDAYRALIYYIVGKRSCIYFFLKIGSSNERSYIFLNMFLNKHIFLFKYIYKKKSFTFFLSHGKVVLFQY